MRAMKDHERYHPSTGFATVTFDASKNCITLNNHANTHRRTYSIGSMVDCIKYEGDSEIINGILRDALCALKIPPTEQPTSDEQGVPMSKEVSFLFDHVEAGVIEFNYNASSGFISIKGVDDRTIHATFALGSTLKCSVASSGCGVERRILYSIIAQALRRMTGEDPSNEPGDPMDHEEVTQKVWATSAGGAVEYDQNKKFMRCTRQNDIPGKKHYVFDILLSAIGRHDFDPISEVLEHLLLNGPDTTAPKQEPRAPLPFMQVEGKPCDTHSFWSTTVAYHIPNGEVILYDPADHSIIIRDGQTGTAVKYALADILAGQSSRKVQEMMFDVLENLMSRTSAVVIEPTEPEPEATKTRTWGAQDVE